ncbi:MAG TPA: 16S rRNA (uracil(1498)-N(3))-methyltransferase [Bacteroidales bacterium]|nr:16S rRNA (uracil(1498)-N(3))-methyltransferase [Bacteroidales bacterium]
MQVFYAPDVFGERYLLDENESRHVVRVMRMTKGDPVMLIDGRGNLYEGAIEEPDQKACRIRILNVIKDFEKRNYKLHIAISPIKNADRFEWFIEKSVEIGVDEITPIICKNTEHKSIRTERLNNLIISAMKQSLKANGSILNEPVFLSDFIKKQYQGIKMIAHCRAEQRRDRIMDVYSKGSNALIMIGPEGDFTSEEIAEAEEKGFRSIHLGTSRLRTETAGVAACHSVYLINQE